jgi:hypothetical protein
MTLVGMKYAPYLLKTEAYEECTDFAKRQGPISKLQAPEG